jgi:fructokinase
VGIAAFGPVDLDPASKTYGYITATPNLPVGFDTDTNAPALAESLWGDARGEDSILYLTVGTGIGGGIVVNGKLIHGLMHPEVGHLAIPHDRVLDPFPGICPYHGDCLEGLANGPAIQARWNRVPSDLPPDHPAWDLEAGYLALGLLNLILTVSPRRIVLGGGVMQQAHLFPRIRRNVLELLNGYIPALGGSVNLDPYISPPSLGSLVGISGALALAMQAADQERAATSTV